MKTEIVLSIVLNAAGLAAVTYSLNPSAPASNVSDPFDGFVSYSIEFSSFPDFAGETTTVARQCQTGSNVPVSR